MPKGIKKEQHRKITYNLISDYASMVETSLDIACLALFSGLPVNQIKYWKENRDKEFTKLSDKYGRFCPNKPLKKDIPQPPDENWFSKFQEENQEMFYGDEKVLPPYSELFFSPLCQNAKNWV